MDLVCAVSMSIEKYFKRSQEKILPSPHGSLSLSVPSRAIAAANKEVGRVLRQQSSASTTTTSKKRGKYNKYSPEERTMIGKHAVLYGNLSAKRFFSRRLGVKIGNSTISCIKTAYKEESARKRELEEEDDDVIELPEKKRGRRVLLGERLDEFVRRYVLQLRERGGAVNTMVVMAGAKGIVETLDRTRLVENGGDIDLTVTWAKSLLKRMNFTKRRATTKCGIPPQVFRDVKAEFLQNVIDVVQMEEIPSQLILNWDQTGIHLVPTSNWMMAKKGSKRVEMKGYEDKQQITGVFCGMLCGEFLPIQLIYKGKTNKCHPSYSFPKDWSITHSDNHWSKESTMLTYIRDIIVPFVDRVGEDLGTDDSQAALALFDHFKGQLTDNVTAALEEHNIQSVLIPATCMDRLQPLDISVNKSAKVFLRSEFQHWYANQISSQQDSADDLNFEPVEMSAPRMKCVGGKWLVRLYEFLLDSPDIIINGFLSSGIPQSIDSGKPYLDESDESSDDGTSEDESEEYDASEAESDEEL